MRKHIVAGNWKMNMDLAQTQQLISSLKLQLVKETDVEILIAPPFTNLYPAFEALRETPIKIAAQNMHQSDNGAFTGEISAKMLKSVGVKTVILGHSERRAMFHESNESLSEKVNTAIANEMTSIFCFGEELEDRKSDNHFNVVKKQIQDGLCHINEKDWSSIVLAYEPVWAIGTGETASPEQAQDMHKFVRNLIAEEYSDEVAQNVSILYGGSVKPNNAKEIFSQPDVDGGLIGGAALDAVSFMQIVHSF